MKGMTLQDEENSISSLSGKNDRSRNERRYTEEHSQQEYEKLKSSIYEHQYSRSLGFAILLVDFLWVVVISIYH